jgi:phosphoesterase RecJ-like protein
MSRDGAAGGVRGGVAEIAAALAEPGTRYVVTSHHNPDGDAIGSMLGLSRAMRAAGLDVSLAHADPDPVPEELAFLLAPGEEIAPALPDDVGERTLVALDCASEKRLWAEPVHRAAGRLINVDHHQDNPAYGHLNLIVPGASSTAEVVVDLIEAAGWPLTRDVAEPLYVGLVTDTGRFSYSNTGPKSHRVAAALMAAGADVPGISRRLYENHTLPRLRLLGRALEASRLSPDGRVMTAVLTKADFAAVGETDTEGIVEVMRGVRGIEVAGLVTEAGPPGAYRVSLRSPGGAGVDVSEIAHVEGGGGHRAAAGFTTRRPPEELVPWIEATVLEALDGR